MSLRRVLADAIYGVLNSDGYTEPEEIADAVLKALTSMPLMDLLRGLAMHVLAQSREAWPDPKAPVQG